MNFLIKTSDGKCVVRPDISFNRKGEDYYVPSDIQRLDFTPTAAVRLSKTGKVISGKFAGRYYDAFAFGLLFYPRPSSAEFCIAEASCFDNSTLIPQPMFPTEIMKGNGFFSVSKDGKEIFRCSTDGITGRIEEAVVACSVHSLSRIGDYVVVELDRIKNLCDRDDGDCRIKTSFCDKISADIEIKF